MKKRVLALALACIMAMATLTGCSTSVEGDDVVATVDGTDITVDIVNFYLRYTQAQYETYYAAYLGEDMWNSAAADGMTYAESVKESVLEKIEDMVILENHMDEYGIELTEEELALIDEAVASFDEANTLENKEYISGDAETVERALTLMAIQQKMMFEIYKGADTNVSDEEAAQKRMDYVYYSFTEQNEDGETVDITEEQKAEYKATLETISDGLKEGQDFTTLAEAAGLEVKNTTFDSETVLPADELIAAADALEAEGDATDVVEGEYGYYVAQLVSLFDKDTTETEKETIIMERKQALYESTLEELRKTAEITVHNNVWKHVDISDLSVTMGTAEDIPYTDEIKTDDQVEE